MQIRRSLTALVVLAMTLAVSAVVVGSRPGPVRAATNWSVVTATTGTMFVPSTLTIHAGDTVTVSQAAGGSAPHNIHWDGLAACPTTPTKDAWSCPRTFQSAGTFAGHCDAHPNMILTVTVVAPPTASATPSPTKAPTPAPTPAPGPTKTPTPTAAATVATPGSTPGPGATNTPTPGSTAGSNPAASPAASLGAAGLSPAPGSALPSDASPSPDSSPVAASSAGTATATPGPSAAAALPVGSSGEGSAAPIVLGIVVAGLLIGGAAFLVRRSRSLPRAPG